MRSILLNIDDDDCLEARLQVSLSLARAFGGHLTCLQTIPVDIAMPGDLSGVFIAEMLPVLRENAQRVRERFEPRLAAEDVAWDWVQEEGSTGAGVLRRSGLSDIVVLGSLDGSSRRATDLTADVVLHARTPVLVVPPGIGTFDCGGPAVVAWDGSPEASRALKAAVPLLAKASSVLLATVLGKGEKDQTKLPPIEGAEYLSRHGIACMMTEFPCEGHSVAQVLADAAMVRDAAYLVMGAYGHARLVETIWGGVTRRLFAEPPLPLLACH